MSFFSSMVLPSPPPLPLLASPPHFPLPKCFSPPVRLLHCSPSLPSAIPSPPTRAQPSLLSLPLHTRKDQLSPLPPSPPFSVPALTSALSHVEQFGDVDSFLQGLQVPLPVLASVIEELGNQKKLQAAFCVYEWLQHRPVDEARPNVDVYGSILGVIAASRNFERFDGVLEEMAKNGVEPNLVTFNCIIASYEEQGLHSEAMNSFEQLEQKGLTPDCTTYIALLRGFEKLNDIQGALRLFSSAQDMFLKNGLHDAVEELKQTVSGVCCRFICSLLLTDKDPFRVLDLLRTIETTIANLCIHDYEQIIWSCGAGARDYVIAKNVLQRRRLFSVPVGVSIHNHVMRVMGKGGKWWAALEVLERMIEEGPAPDEDSYAIIRSHFNYLLRSSRDKSTSSWSLQLLEKMEAHGILPDRFAWDTAMVTCAKKADAEGAVLVFQKMIERGQHPSIVSYGALLSALEKCGFFEKAEQVWEHMKRKGVKPNIEAYTIMVSVYGRSQKYEVLLRLVDEMRASGVQFSLIPYNAIITACANLGEAKGALHWMKELSAEGFRPNATTYGQLIKALCQGGEAESARDMYIEAKKSQVVLSPLAYDSVIEACRTHNVECDLDAIIAESSHMESEI